MSGLFRRLKEFDNTLTEITLNNMKELDDVLIAVADFLAKMDCVTKISVANTRMNNNIGLVGKMFDLFQRLHLFVSIIN